MSGHEETRSKKYELVPPDGGWGYMVGLAVTINLMTVYMFIPCFGMIYNQLFLELNMNSTDITVMNGISAVVIAATGFLITPLLRFLSIRQLGFISAVIFNTGLFLIVFVRSKVTFVICTAIGQSFGNGMIFNLSFTALNNYFVKKRLLAISVTQTVIGVITLVTPHFVHWTLDTYGLRGTLLLISGISMQNFIGMVLLQPAEWHMKRVEIPEKEENEVTSFLASEKQKENDSLISSLEISHIENKKERVDEKQTLNEQEKNNNKDLKIALSKFVDAPFLKTFLSSNASVGLALCIFADITITLMLPQFLYNMSWSESDVALALSLNATGDLVTRILFIFTTKWLASIGSHEIYVIGLFICFLSRLGMLWSENMTLVLVFITMAGISKCPMLILVPVVIVDAVGETKFTTAMGIYLALYGFFTMVLGPAVGAIRDLTTSYATAFYVLTSCIGFVVMFWTIELVYKKNKHKRVLKNESPKQ